MVLNSDHAGECFNIGGHNEWANIDIVRLICRLMDERFAGNAVLGEKYPEAKAAKAGRSADLITFVKDRPGHDRRYAIDAARSREILGYTPQESFETGIQKTVQWYLDNDEWWKRVMDGRYQDWIEQQY
jgi:dTDP-glucose 4,6-dehydratase